MVNEKLAKHTSAYFTQPLEDFDNLEGSSGRENMISTDGVATVTSNLTIPYLVTLTPL